MGAESSGWPDVSSWRFDWILSDLYRSIDGWRMAEICHCSRKFSLPMRVFTSMIPQEFGSLRSKSESKKISAGNRESGLGLWLTSKLQLITGTGRENRQQEVSRNSRQLKIFGKGTKSSGYCFESAVTWRNSQDKRPILSGYSWIWIGLSRMRILLPSCTVMIIGDRAGEEWRRWNGPIIRLKWLPKTVLVRVWDSRIIDSKRKTINSRYFKERGSIMSDAFTDMKWKLKKRSRPMKDKWLKWHLKWTETSKIKFGRLIGVYPSLFIIEYTNDNSFARVNQLIPTWSLTPIQIF